MIPSTAYYHDHDEGLDLGIRRDDPDVWICNGGDGRSSIEPHILDGFVELFEGRDDVVFVDDQHHVRQDKCPEGIPEGMWRYHLTGGDGIGIYPLRDGRECRWICTDLDKGDTLSVAKTLVKAWEYYGVQAWIETSKSKGHHVWVFCEDWVSGTIARRAGLYIHQMAEVDPEELNPKQEITDGYGNTVRLPYWEQWLKDHPGRTVILGDHQAWLLEDWVPLALDTRCDPDILFRLANRYTPPENRPQRRSGGDWDGSVSDGYYQAREVWLGNEDVPEGNRDNTFYTMAQRAFNIGIPYHEARETFQEIWNEQVQNKKTYPLTEAMSKLNRVYGGRP